MVTSGPHAPTTRKFARSAGALVGDIGVLLRHPHVQPLSAHRITVTGQPASSSARRRVSTPRPSDPTEPPDPARWPRLPQRSPPRRSGRHAIPRQRRWPSPTLIAARTADAKRTQDLADHPLSIPAWDGRPREIVQAHHGRPAQRVSQPVGQRALTGATLAVYCKEYRPGNAATQPAEVGGEFDRGYSDRHITIVPKLAAAASVQFR